MQQTSLILNAQGQRPKRAWTLSLLSALCLGSVFAAEHAQAHHHAFSDESRFAQAPMFAGPPTFDFFPVFGDVPAYAYYPSYGHHGHGHHAVPSRNTRPPVRLEIVLMRHGVRAPTTSNDDLSVYSNQAWPTWPVDPGILTPHGADVMKALGQRYRAEYLKRGILHDGCNLDQVVTISDSTPRNQVSTQAFLSGFQPNCIAKFYVAENADANPLFHFPAKTTDKADKADILPPESSYPALAELQQVLLGCDGPECWNAAAAKKHTLLWQGSPQAKSLKNAGTLSENIMLEYAEGMPLDQIGWGRVDEAAISRLITLHNTSFALTKAAMPKAAQAGSNLMTHILSTLQEAAGQTSDSAPLAPLGTKSLILLGHDSNFAHLAGLLNTSWNTINQADQFPPGGALVFDLIEKNQQYYVTVRTKMPMLSALRHADFKAHSTLKTTTLRLDACNGQRECPLDQFVSWASARLDQASIQKTLPAMIETSSPIKSTNKSAGKDE